MSKRNKKRGLSKILDNYTPSLYTRKRKFYLRHTFIRILPILKGLAKQSPFACLYPVYKLLRAAAKLFLLNEIEAIMFVVMLKGTGWKIDDVNILKSSGGMGALISFHNDLLESKQLMLYIMLAAFAAKYSLNSQCAYLLDQAERLCQNFENIFRAWIRPNNNLLTISLPVFNSLYSTMLCPIKAQIADYHLVVDQIILLSQPYNPPFGENIVNQIEEINTCQLTGAQQEHLQHHSTVDIQAQFIGNSFEYFSNSVQVKVETIQVFDHHYMTISQFLPDLYANNLRDILCLPTIKFNCLNFDHEEDSFEVGLCEGQSDNFVMFGHLESTLPSILYVENILSSKIANHQILDQKKQTNF